jgi:hypothetical protein
MAEEGVGLRSMEVNKGPVGPRVFFVNELPGKDAEGVVQYQLFLNGRAVGEGDFMALGERVKKDIKPGDVYVEGRPDGKGGFEASVAMSGKSYMDNQARIDAADAEMA